jgi:hypothetical protein
MTPGGAQQPGEPGGPLDEESRPEGGDAAQPSAPAGGAGTPLTEGGPTQQGEEQAAPGTPGGDQPDTGGPQQR